LTRLAFLRRLWPLPCLRLLTLPRRVIRKRFAVALWVFILGMLFYILLWCFRMMCGLGDLNVKDQGFPGQWVVDIESDGRLCHAGDEDGYPSTLW